MTYLNIVCFLKTLAAMVRVIFLSMQRGYFHLIFNIGTLYSLYILSIMALLIVWKVPPAPAINAQPLK